MIKPIGPQYKTAKASQRVGMTHVSKVIRRLMRVYGLEDELVEQQELKASDIQCQEFGEPVLMPSVPVGAGTQSTFSWFE